MQDDDGSDSDIDDTPEPANDTKSHQPQDAEQQIAIDRPAAASKPKNKKKKKKKKNAEAPQAAHQSGDHSSEDLDKLLQDMNIELVWNNVDTSTKSLDCVYVSE